MIHLTRLNHIPTVINSDLIEYIEATPDTVVALTSGQKVLVLEPVDEVIARVVEFRRSILHGVPCRAALSELSSQRLDEAQSESVTRN